jgi:MscS family membrane protein
MDTIKWRSTLRAFMCRSIAFAAILVLATLVLSDSALAQATQPKLKEILGESPEEEEAKEEQEPEAAKPKDVRPIIPDDEFDRGTPRRTVQGFMKATGKGEYERAEQYLELSNLARGLTEKEGRELARELRIVLDRALWVDYDLFSDDPRGNTDDGLPRGRDRLGRIETPEKNYDILLEQIPRGDGVYIWKFSSATMAQIPRLYAHFGYGPLGEALSAVFPQVQILGMKLWQWVVLLGLAAMGYLIALLVTKAAAFFLLRKETELRHLIARLFTGPIRFFIIVLIIRTGIDLVRPTVTARALAETNTLVIVAVVWTIMRLFDIIADRLAHRFRRRGQGAVTVLLRPLFTAAKVLVVIIGAMLWLDNIGFKVTTLLAGLGVGGLAVALAAQRSIENMIGGITLYISRPVRVGDFCRFANTIGTVEEIGLRATRVRTLDRTVVNVPNAEFVRLHLENFMAREKIWYHPRIRLRYETTPDQIRFILVEVRKLLYSHPKVLPDPARIRFVEFGEHSLDLDIFAYIDVRDYGEFLEVAEDLNLRIMDIIAKSGSSLAVPSQTTYLERGKGLNEELAREAEAQVKRWRKKDELYLPGFPQEKIEELRGSLDYPPTGSPGARDSQGK